MIDPSKIFHSDDDYLYNTQCFDEGSSLQANECQEQECTSTEQYWKEKEEQLPQMEPDPNQQRYDLVAAAIQETIATDAEDPPFEPCTMSGNLSFDHSVRSTNEESGIFVVMFPANKPLPNNLLLSRANAVMGNLNVNRERLVAVRSSPVGKDPLPFHNDLHVVVMPCSVYIKMLEFVKNKWPNVCSRILKRCQEESESGLDIFDEGYKWHRIDDHFSVSGGGPVRIKYILYQTNRNQVLYLRTEGIPTPGMQPPLSVTLGWTEEALGKVTLSPKALGILGEGLEKCKAFLAGRESVSPEKSEMALGSNPPPPQINLPQQPVQQHLLQKFNQGQQQHQPPPFQSKDAAQRNVAAKRSLPPGTSILRLNNAQPPPPPPRRPKTPGSSMPIPSTLTSSAAAAKKRRTL